MRKYNLLLILFFPLLLCAQLRQQQVVVCDLVMSSQVSSTEFLVTLENFQDAQNTGLLPAQIVADSFRLIENSTQTLYEITEVISTSFSKANVRIEEVEGDAPGIPSGRTVLYRYDHDCDIIFIAPGNQQGIPNTLLAKLHNHNLLAVQICVVVDGGRVDSIAFLQDTILVSYDKELNELSRDTLSFSTGALQDLTPLQDSIRVNADSIFSYDARLDSLDARPDLVDDADNDPTNEFDVVAEGNGIDVNQVGRTFTVVNTQPDQEIQLNEGSNVQIEGNYPDFTISATQASNIVEDMANGTNTLTTSAPSNAVIFAVVVSGYNIKQGVDWTAENNVITFLGDIYPPANAQIQTWYKL